MRTTSTSLFDFRSLLAPPALIIRSYRSIPSRISIVHIPAFGFDVRFYIDPGFRRNRVVGINNKTVFERHFDAGSRDRLFRLRAPPSCVYKIIVPSFLDRQVCAPNYSDRIAGNLGSTGKRAAYRRVRRCVFKLLCVEKTNFFSFICSGRKRKRKKNRNFILDLMEMYAYPRVLMRIIRVSRERLFFDIFLFQF